MRQRKAVLIFSAILILLFGVQSVSAQDEKVDLLFDSIKVFNQSLTNGGYGKIWELKTTRGKGHISKEEFVSYFEANFIGSTLFSRFLSVRLIRENIAFSKSLFVIIKDSGNDEQCDGILWVWSGTNWNYIAAFPCDQEAIRTSDKMLPIYLRE